MAAEAQLARLFLIDDDVKTAPLDACLVDAQADVRAALTTAGIREHRAMLTGRAADGDAHAESLAALDRTYATLWAYEAASAKLRVVDVDSRRVALLESIERGLAAKRAAMSSATGDKTSAAAGGLSKVLGELRAAHRDLAAVRPLPEAAIRLPRLMLADDEGQQQLQLRQQQQQQQQLLRQNSKVVRQRLRQNARAAFAPSPAPSPHPAPHRQAAVALRARLQQKA